MSYASIALSIDFNGSIMEKHSISKESIAKATAAWKSYTVEDLLNLERRPFKIQDNKKMQPKIDTTSPTSSYPNRILPILPRGKPATMATPPGFLECVLSANEDTKAWAKSKASDSHDDIYGTIGTLDCQLQPFGGHDSMDYANRKYRAGQTCSIMYGASAEGNIINTTSQYQVYAGRTVEQNAIKLLVPDTLVTDIFTREGLVAFVVDNAEFLYDQMRNIFRTNWIKLSTSGPEIGEHGLSNVKKHSIRLSTI